MDDPGDPREDALRVGPSEDFDTWVRPHIGRIRRVARRHSSVTDAEDVTQDSMLRAWQQRDAYQADRGSAEAWLATIVADQARRRWRRTRPGGELVPPVAFESDPTSDLALRQAIRLLPPRQREAVIRFYYLDLSVMQTAAAMGCSVGTVKSTLSDARRGLRQQLGDSDE